MEDEMAYEKAPANHTEFGGGEGMIDPEMRKDRIIGQSAETLAERHLGEELWEIYATNPSVADEELDKVLIERPTAAQIAALTGDV